MNDVTTPGGPNYFEDFAEGMRFRSSEITVDLAAIVRFAAEFDPQPFHLDAGAAKNLFFGELVASGWHTAAVTMRLLVESGLSIAGGIIGAGGEIKWPAALRPGDAIHVDIEVIGTRRLRSRNELGMITTRARTVTATGTVVQELTANLFVPLRNVAPHP